MVSHTPLSHTSRMLENKVKIEPFINNCLERWVFHRIIFSTLSSCRYEYVSWASFWTPNGRFSIVIAADWLSECWGNVPSPSSALLADRNRWDNPPFLLRNIAKKWLCTCVRVPHPHVGWSDGGCVCVLAHVLNGCVGCGLMLVYWYVGALLMCKQLTHHDYHWQEPQD